MRHIPQINASYWSFILAGQVEVPLLLSYADLLSLPSVELPATLACAGNSGDTPLISTGLWRGVSLTTLLNKVTFKSGAAHLRVYAADGYVTSFPVEKAPDLLLAYRMNGEPLRPEHGYPARLIAPGLYGYKMPRWVQRLEVATTPASGFWEQRGWSASGEAGVMAAITSPHHQQALQGQVTFTGIAYAGKNTVTAIELSVDNSPWMPVEFAPPPPYCWAEWSAAWQPPAPGAYRVQVRAAADTRAASNPHSITLHVTH